MKLNQRDMNVMNIESYNDQLIVSYWYPQKGSKKGQKRVKNDPLITKGTPLKYPQNAPFFRENVPQKVRFSHFSFNAPYPVGGVSRGCIQGPNSPYP